MALIVGLMIDGLTVYSYSPLRTFQSRLVVINQKILALPAGHTNSGAKALEHLKALEDGQLDRDTKKIYPKVSKILLGMPDIVHPEELRSCLPPSVERPGFYVIFAKRRDGTWAVYVGSALDMYLRQSQHKTRMRGAFRYGDGWKQAQSVHLEIAKPEYERIYFRRLMTIPPEKLEFRAVLEMQCIILLDTLSAQARCPYRPPGAVIELKKFAFEHGLLRKPQVKLNMALPVYESQQMWRIYGKMPENCPSCQNACILVPSCKYGGWLCRRSWREKYHEQLPDEHPMKAEATDGVQIVRDVRGQSPIKNKRHSTLQCPLSVSWQARTFL
ncbi:uncharacterized protein DSM5745_01180 [Aspergillus mulundensis]|uniref:GIY-YIG domain-containing protein n=1 Tax=Aspergillus mulundensis TaxID=1810919 RepID=A0A3D8T769_9EURO|nr:hypothetical protein DSM5745_01180 [Aspergillus mulundensis]RDW93858.1 hypothetical protein DSM5745_01180 [Aspergillus mulundensis]